MGSLDKNVPCQTCQAGMGPCPGHFGHITLGNPVFHIGFMTDLVDVLRCVCFHCSRLLIDKNRDPRYAKILKLNDPDTRLKALQKIAARKTKCYFPGPQKAAQQQEELHEGCHTKKCPRHIPIIRLTDNIKLTAEFPIVYKEYGEKQKVNLTAKMVRKILKRIDPEDYAIMGFDPVYCEPASLTIRTLPVPPPILRPTNKSNAAAKGEDESTHKLVDIIRTNNNLVQLIQKRDQGIKTASTKDGSKPIDSVIQDYTQMLQVRVAEYFDADSVGQQNAMQRLGRPSKSIVQKLKGKEGRVRGNLMGKRVDFSARTVISPDPNISVDTVGVPRSVAANLTFPEKVNIYNIDRLTRAVKMGPKQVDGASFIKFSDGRRIDLKIAKWEQIEQKYGGLQMGMDVERHLIDGEYVTLNRQPSLHKFSIMCFRAKIMPYSTFRYVVIFASFLISFMLTGLFIYAQASTFRDHSVQCVSTIYHVRSLFLNFLLF